MKTKVKHSAPISQTIQSISKAANQAPIEKIMQCYQDKTIQRQNIDEDELLQGKFENSQLSIFNSQLNKTGLPDNLKTNVENLSGYSMDDVRVHYNSGKPAQLQALAYTQGTDIHVAPGQEKHLPHEAWHVVQQKQGRVHPTMQLQGINVNDNEGLEREADVMGRKNILNTDNKTLNQKKTTLSINEVLNTRTIQRQPSTSFESHLKPEKTKEGNVLVYGTEDARLQQRNLSTSAMPKGFLEKEMKAPSGPATSGLYSVDRYNNYAWRDFESDRDNEKGFSLFNNNYVYRQKQENPNDFNQKIKEDVAQWSRFSISNTTNKNKTEINAFREKLFNHPFYSPIETLKENGGQKEHFDKQTVRACKFGLEFMKEKKGEVLFLTSVYGDRTNPTEFTDEQNNLYTLQLPQNEEKWKKGEPTNSASVLSPDTTTGRPLGGDSSPRIPITIKEMRKLFRIRSGMSGTFFIDSKGNQRKAPWNIGGDESKGWKEYALRRLKKYKYIATQPDIEKKSPAIKDIKEIYDEAMSKKAADAILQVKQFVIETIRGITPSIWMKELITGKITFPGMSTTLPQPTTLETIDDKVWGMQKTPDENTEEYPKDQYYDRKKWIQLPSWAKRKK